jgi:hypothetical protein
MDRALQKAIDSLRIRDVYLQSGVADIAEDFDPKYNDDIELLNVQFKHIVAKSAVLELKDEDETICLFRVYIDLGARWVVSPKQENEEPKERARIEATMVAEYIMTEDPGPEALESFALRNASFHVWPYWREYLSAQCLRMNLPKITLPAVQLAVNRKH